MTLPKDFELYTRNLMGEKLYEAFNQGLSEEAPTSIRINPFKVDADNIIIGNGNELVPWCKYGHYLSGRPPFTFDPMLHSGAYYVQEASSMFIDHVVRQTFGSEPMNVLDLCAAPGGKSTCAMSALPEGSMLFSNEPIRPRAMVLAENITKFGKDNMVVTNNYPADYKKAKMVFDAIIADVPCSGEGMFRKDEVATEEWTPEAVISCAERQWNIVESVWPTLRQGGYLVYSTCTYNRAEDEDNVLRICQELGAELVPIATDPSWGIVGDTTGRELPVYHFFPHHAKGEGLFLALLRKTAEAPQLKEKKNKRQRGGKQSTAIKGGAQVAAWLKQNEAFKLLRIDEAHITAVREALADDVQRICNTVRALTAGVLLVEEKGNKRIPQHALALSMQRNAEAFPTVALTREEALTYLRREALVLSPDVPRGYVIATYQGHSLGFLNNLGSRANNLYPQEWRIRN